MNQRNRKHQWNAEVLNEPMSDFVSPTHRLDNPPWYFLHVLGGTPAQWNILLRLMHLAQHSALDERLNALCKELHVNRDASGWKSHALCALLAKEGQAVAPTVELFKAANIRPSDPNADYKLLEWLAVEEGYVPGLGVKKFVLPNGMQPPDLALFLLTVWAVYRDLGSGVTNKALAKRLLDIKYLNGLLSNRSDKHVDFLLGAYASDGSHAPDDESERCNWLTWFVAFHRRFAQGARSKKRREDQQRTFDLQKLNIVFSPQQSWFSLSVLERYVAEIVNLPKQVSDPTHFQQGIVRALVVLDAISSCTPIDINPTTDSGCDLTP